MVDTLSGFHLENAWGRRVAKDESVVICKGSQEHSLLEKFYHLNSWRLLLVTFEVPDSVILHHLGLGLGRKLGGWGNETWLGEMDETLIILYVSISL